MDKLFVVGDVHGQLNMLNKLLTKWNPDSERLVFVGDYIDRGHDSYGAIHLVKDLHEKYGAVALGGNHEAMFLEWLDNPEDVWFSKWQENESIINFYEEAGNSTSIWYVSNGGDKTINSFYSEENSNNAYKYLPSRNANYIKNNFPDEVDFIRSLPNYFEWKNFVCVHAGVNLAYDDWKKTDESEFRWIRTPFHHMKNETGKNFVFGHTPTRNLHHDKYKNNVWLSPCKTKIGIDGGAVFGGLLHGLVIDGNQVSVNSVNTNLHIIT
ncbi:MAG: metallophosphoesterase [Bacillales bacterium]|jgi:serine/threonine protein phosphatase 1|nr:metallophosphoesterase [Bacillales bacterium]